MIVVHEIDIDLVNSGEIHRIHAEQGDVKSRRIDISLLENGEDWKIGGNTTAVIRYCARDIDNTVTSHGLYDTLENGNPAYLVVGNVISLLPLDVMMENPGLVTVEVLLVEGEKMVSTFNFEIYVHRSPNTETQVSAEN